MDYAPLDTFRFPENTCIPQAEPKAQGSVTLNSPAFEVMTDLAQVKAATIHPSTPLAQAEQVMIHQGVRSLFVVSAWPCVDGLVTSGDLVGDKPVRLLTQRGLRYQDLCVADVMSDLSTLEALDYAQVKTATVGHIAATLNRTGHTHLLVIQAANAQGPARIRGVISLTQVERQLAHSLIELLAMTAA